MGNYNFGGSPESLRFPRSNLKVRSAPFLTKTHDFSITLHAILRIEGIDN